MQRFEKYFSNKAIIRTLCKYRIKQAKKKHKYHLLRDVSLHPISIFALHNKNNCPLELQELFPSRRQWLRPNLEERKKYNNSQDLNIYALYKTVVHTHISVINNKITSPLWYTKLSLFINKIQERARNPDSTYLQAPIIKPIRKEKLSGICRPISLYSLEDRLIISLTAKYMTDIFEPYLHDCSFAFRSSKVEIVRTHHDAISEILKYKKQKDKENIWVAECDLKKFFDCVNQKLIIKTFEQFETKVIEMGLTFSENAKKIFIQYLWTYSFNKDVLSLNGTKYFLEYNIQDGEYEWPLEELKKEFYGEDIVNETIGIPQGGALSCLIANLILHSVDEFVDSSPKDDDMLYLRFCDDMVLLHTNKERSNQALLRYREKVHELKLLIHKPHEVYVYDKNFWKTKSKSPYNWSNKTSDVSNVPWLAFVGYQIRRDGLIRVRKKSLFKEINKQQDEVKQVLKSLGHHSKTRLLINTNSRKSRKQQIFALESRLISMSVGRMNLYAYKNANHGLCWTNGFKKLSINSVSKYQCKYLDKRRSRNLYKFKKELIHLSKHSENSDKRINKFYLGHPFSYYGFLIKY